MNEAVYQKPGKDYSLVTLDLVSNFPNVRELNTNQCWENLAVFHSASISPNKTILAIMIGLFILTHLKSMP